MRQAIACSPTGLWRHSSVQRRLQQCRYDPLCCSGIERAQGPASSRSRQSVMASAVVESSSMMRTEESASTSASSILSQGRSKWIIDENEELKSTIEHRAWTLGSMALMGGSMFQAVIQAQDLGSTGWLSLGMAVLSAYVLSDLGTGIYHWSVDNYGDGKTPFVGKQIAAFQGHHQRPWTITQRQFCNNVHQVFRPAAAPALLFLLFSSFSPLWWNAFSSSFLFLICMSQQFHAWSHMKKSDLPEAVLKLQDWNILISRRAHGAHHRAPFEGNYCIVSGWWNGPLDDSGFFRGLENAVLASTGVEPRCWHEPEYAIEEEVPSPRMSFPQ
ncbi:hypothetical protein CEUSTIGMA_g10615.t1 [Chlamydomonas eustigma]|uniref:Lipid desaturase domain-containing protein n=1 Tax=Chlamydomonas eustigma TaxID=1157962 RepID=A0A250XJT8_9CHLO|nr:hypothetical protein CEUSTIGMA_g10615.t1 [Chlamydomonas eustigma]|eukprot:GAX83189.1 hypothetical protein CEUSTIGMA_g10615.t1 [Chlamydomonas eustigma]